MKLFQHTLSFISLCFVLAGPLFLPSEAKAQMRWIVQNEQSEPVGIAFYSRNRKKDWPGNGRAFSLSDHRTYTYDMDCNPGERVCLGAWSLKSSKQWGVGRGDKQSCSDCCYYCIANITPKQVLK
jgi:hypothetical protein